jgi:glycosyltransferase involved in cell wall biosynthesis
MKALVLAPQPFFSPRGTPFSVYYRTLVTAEQNTQVDLLTYGEGQDVDIPGVRIIRIPHVPLFGPVKVGPSFKKIILDVLMIIWTIALLIRHRYDFVHAHEEAVFYCLALKPIFKFKLVYDMHSSLPQQLTNFNFTELQLFIRLFTVLENACLRNADAVITICPDLKEHVDHLLGPTEKHFLIENSIFEQVKLKSNSNRSNQSENPICEMPLGKKLIVYAGTLEPYQGIDLLIEAYAIAAEKIPDSRLLIVGGSDIQVTHYRRMAERLKIDQETYFTGKVPQKAAKKFVNSADLLVSPRISGTNTPLKVYEQLACGIPLLATRIYSHTQVLSDTVAFLVDPDPVSMGQGIVEALESSTRRDQISLEARKLYETNYSRPIYEQKMRELLSLISN